MGKAKIISGGSGGLYNIELVKDIARITAQIAAITARLVVLAPAIAAALTAKNTAEAYLSVKRAALDEAIGKLILKQITATDVNTAQSVFLAALTNYESKRIAYSLLLQEQESKTKSKTLLQAVVLPDTRNGVWCADLTENLAAGEEVGTIEVNGESKHIIIFPGGHYENLEPLREVSASKNNNNKVVITWIAVTAAKGYRVYRDNKDISGLLGGVSTFDDTGAAAPVIIPGSSVASDGSSADHVALSLSGQSVVATTHTYKVVAIDDKGQTTLRGTNIGYRLPGVLTYQWQKSAADIDGNYSDISGGNNASFNDTTAPADGSGRYYKCKIDATGSSQKISLADRGYRLSSVPASLPVSASKNNNNKVIITWTKVINATGYRVYRDDSDISGLLGDVSTFDDTGAAAPVIIPGSSVASDGSSVDHVALSLSGQSVVATTHTYKVAAIDAEGQTTLLGTNMGYRLPGVLTYQWQKSAADVDDNYSDISGGNNASFNDTTAPADGSGRYYKCKLNATGSSQLISIADRGYRKSDTSASSLSALLQPVLASTPAGVFYNLAILPGWQRWKPTYRIGTIETISGMNASPSTCSVRLVAALSSVQKLNINPPEALLSNVPIEYMDGLNGSVFVVGDRVVIEFTGQSWAAPKVIGFETNPRGTIGNLILLIRDDSVSPSSPPYYLDVYLCDEESTSLIKRITISLTGEGFYAINYISSVQWSVKSHSPILGGSVVLSRINTSGKIIGQSPSGTGGYTFRGVTTNPEKHGILGGLPEQLNVFDENLVQTATYVGANKLLLKNGTVFTATPGMLTSLISDPVAVTNLVNIIQVGNDKIAWIARSSLTHVRYDLNLPHPYNEMAFWMTDYLYEIRIADIATPNLYSVLYNPGEAVRSGLYYPATSELYCSYVGGWCPSYAKGFYGGPFECKGNGQISKLTYIEDKELFYVKQEACRWDKAVWTDLYAFCWFFGKFGYGFAYTVTKPAKSFIMSKAGVYKYDMPVLPITDFIVDSTSVPSF